MSYHCFSTTISSETLKEMKSFIQNNNMDKYILFSNTNNEDILRYIFIELPIQTISRLNKIDLDKLVKVAQKTNEGHYNFALINHKLIKLGEATIRQTTINNNKLDKFEFNPMLIQIDYDNIKNKIKSMLYKHNHIKEVTDLIYNNNDKILFDDYTNKDLIYVLIHIKLNVLSRLTEPDINKLLSIKSELYHINKRIKSLKRKIDAKQD